MFWRYRSESTLLPRNISSDTRCYYVRHYLRCCGPPEASPQLQDCTSSSFSCFCTIHQNRTIHAVGNNTHNGACRIIPQHVYQQAQRHQLSLLPLVPFGVEGRR